MERKSERVGAYDFYPHPVIHFSEELSTHYMEIFPPQKKTVTTERREWTIKDYWNYLMNDEKAPTETRVTTPIERTDDDLVLRVNGVSGFSIEESEKEGEDGQTIKEYYVEYYPIE